mgnify:CR=1 FL=1
MNETIENETSLNTPPSDPKPEPTPGPAPQPAPTEEATTSITPPPSPNNPRPRARRPYPPTWSILLIILGVVIIIGVGAGALLSMQSARPTGGAESLGVNKLSTFDSPPTLPPDISVVEENNTPMITVQPERINITGRAFNLVPVTEEKGRWPIPARANDTAVWLYGTVVNYVIGVPYTETTTSLLAGLTGSDRITLTLDNGTALIFGSPQAQRIAPNDTGPMAQRQPGLTIVVLGGDQATRLIVKARYLPEESTESEGQRVDGLSVEVLKSGVVEEAGDTRRFVVEYEVNNEGKTPVDPTFFDLMLEDGEGQRYPLNASVTAQGEHGALQAPVATGESAQGSAGYLIPRNVEPPITWIFRADPASTEAARFVLPYQPPPPRPPEPRVELTSAFADSTRDVIVINGVLHNDGASPLTVTREDISLTSSQGASSLQASTPLAPWTVEADGQMNFEVQFSRPTGVDKVLFGLVGFTFEIEGLP